MEKSLKLCITNGEFEEAEKIARLFSFQNFRDEMLEIAFDLENMQPYYFISYLLTDNEDQELHMLASEILSTALSFHPDAYRLAFEHAKSALELDPLNIEYKEYMLLFHRIPDKLLAYKAASTFAKDVLEQKPDSSVASSFFKD
ncbi:hypothetical protein [Listeria grandensis]|uniref:hypothetical protein n=1 Tax=Listeria grandensis TaxID=1494963 RepID=UPI00164D294D|nr:hypothetical protein [Listeria grandensis]MBC6314388.1 hypothetical protein [Listeria grandensis]